MRIFGSKKPSNVQSTNGVANGMSGKNPPLLLHFDVNKTVIQSDSIQRKSIEVGIREGISELFWGHVRTEGSEKVWEWTRGKPSCAPPVDDIMSVGKTLYNYAQYCKLVVQNKDERKQKVMDFSLVKDPEAKYEMEKLLQLTLRKMELSPEVRKSKDAEDAGIKGPTYNMFPTLFHLVASLLRGKRVFAILFRSFGADHEKIKTEWNAFCELKHPIFSRLIEDIGPLDGSVPHIPDRRIHKLHTLYRDAHGPVLLLDTFTNGPKDNSWDSWARSNPKPKSDTRAGRQFIQQSLKVKTVEGFPKIQSWMKQHLMSQGTAAIKDDWAWWQFNNEQAHAGKLLTMIGTKKTIQQIFFDDNIDYKDARIVDCRDANGSTIPTSKALVKLCMKVNPVEAMLDNDYFLRKLLASQGDHLDVGASIFGLQKQLTEVEEEKGGLQKELSAIKLQLKNVSEENRRMKLARRLNIRDEAELANVLSDAGKFGQGGYKSLGDLMYELDEGHCWLERNESGHVIRVIDMIYMRIYFKDQILVEMTETNAEGRAFQRHYLPGTTMTLKDGGSFRRVLDRWFENGLHVGGSPADIKKIIETEMLPAPFPEAPHQETAAMMAYPVPCQLQQSVGSFIIPEKEVDLNKELLGRIGLPLGKPFTSTEQDIHGGTITRFFRWQKRATFEPSSVNKKGSLAVNSVHETCEKVFKNNKNADVYTKLLLMMFEVFDAQKLCGGFSGSVVIRVQPFEADNRAMDPCIVKLDNGDAIKEEFQNSANVFHALPDRAAMIIGEAVYEKDGNGDEFGAMRLELAGACWNVPELAQGSGTLLSTFKDLLLYESEQVLLQSMETKNNETLFGNVNSVLAETFGPGGIVRSLRKGGRGLRREEKRPIFWSWYTLKGKESKFNIFTAPKGSYPAEAAMRKLYKEHFGGEMPKLQELVTGTIKNQLQKLNAQTGKEFSPLVGLAHGDLNAANIMIDALDAVWLIDFATSVELPLFTDMCKFEMACLFEYATIPITPKLLVDFASTSPEKWAEFNVADWLHVDPIVAFTLLKSLVNLPQERLSSLSQSDIDKLAEEAAKSSGKAPEKQQKLVRALKARLAAEEAVTDAAFAYCNNISNILLQGDSIRDTLEQRQVPPVEGRGAAGAKSLRFFMDIVQVTRRYMKQDVMSLLQERDQTKDGLQICDALSLQLWLPFLRESYRIIGYTDIAPQYKVWSIYHCQKIAKNVQRILEVITKNLTKVDNIGMLSTLRQDFKAMNQKKDDKKDANDDQNVGKNMQVLSHWIHANSSALPVDEIAGNAARKLHAQCPVYADMPGFFSPVWQVLQVDSGAKGETVLPLKFGANHSARPKKTSSQLLELLVEDIDEAGHASQPSRVSIGSVTTLAGGSAEVELKSRFFPMSVGMLRHRFAEAFDQPPGADWTSVNSNFSITDWSNGVVGDTEAAARKAGTPQNGSAARSGTPAGAKDKDYTCWMTMEAIAIDNSKKEKMKLVLCLGSPTYCYPQGTNICIDLTAEGGIQAKHPSAVVTKLNESGHYSIHKMHADAEAETEVDLTPANHTYVVPVMYAEKEQLIVRDSSASHNWFDAEVEERSASATAYQYRLVLKSPREGEIENTPVTQHLSVMNSSQRTGISAAVFEEEIQKFKLFYKVRHSFIIDALSGKKLSVRECALPNLSIVSTFQGSQVRKEMSRTRSASKYFDVSKTNTSQTADSNGQEARNGWSQIANCINTYDKAIPTCSPNAFLVIGNPGSGKSCLIGRLIVDAQDRYTNLVPLLIPVTDLVKRSTENVGPSKMDDVAVAEWFDKYLRIILGEDSPKYNMICQSMKMNRIMFMFEGMEDSGVFMPVIEHCIKNLILNRHLVIVTSRPLAVLDDISEYMVTMTLQNLTDEQMRQVSFARLGPEGFLLYKDLHKRLADSQASDAGDGGEMDVFGNPLMLSMLLCYLQTEQSKINKEETEGPEEKAPGEEDGAATLTSIYRVAINVLLLRLQSKTQADRHLRGEKVEQDKRILEIMALQMCLNEKQDEQGESGIAVSDVDAIIKEEFKDDWDKLKAAVQAGHAMILRMSGEAGKAVFTFLEKRIQAYFAASAIAHQEGRQLPGLVPLLTEKRWVQPLEMLAEEWPHKYVTIMETRLENFQTVDGDSFLHIAARAGHRPVFQHMKLFSPKYREALWTRMSDTAKTPLHVAAEKGNTQLCGYMIEHNAPIDAEDSKGRLALHVAMQHGAFQTAKKLNELWNVHFQDRPYHIRQKKNQAEGLAARILAGGLAEDEFKLSFLDTFVELSYFSEKEKGDRDRTYCALLSIYWITSNLYNEFTRKQQEKEKLTKSSWDMLQDWTNRLKVVKKPTVLAAMLTHVAIMNLGKIAPFKKAFAPDIDSPPQVVASILQKYPILVPSFNKLDEKMQQTILAVLKIDFNLGQFVQAENLPANLKVMKQILEGGDSTGNILGFFLFQNFVSTCGVKGPQTLEGSLLMNNQLYANFNVGNDVLQHLTDESAEQVYNRFLGERAKGQNLSLRNELESRAIARLACLARVFDAKGGKEVYDAFYGLDQKTRTNLTKYINRDGITEKPGYLLFKAPDAMEQAKKNQNIGLALGMQMLLHVYEAAASLYNSGDVTVVTIYVDDLVPRAKDCTDAESFEFTKFEITRSAGAKADSQGKVDISPWQIVNDQQFTEQRQEDALSLCHDLLHGAMRERTFTERLKTVFPELRFFEKSDETGLLRKETLGGLLTVYWTVGDQVEPFARGQETDKKLTDASWSSLKAFTDNATRDPEILNSVFVIMALSSLGKLPKFRNQLAPKAEGHKQVMGTVMETCPKVLVSYWRLSTNHRRLVQEVLTRDFNFVQFLSAELVPANLTTLKELLKADTGLSRKQLLAVYLYCVFAEMAGSMGPSSLEGSVYMTEEKWIEFQEGRNALEKLEHDNEMAIYDQILAKRMVFMENWKFDRMRPESRAVARLACLFNVTNSTDGRRVIDAYEGLDIDERASLTKYLTADGIVQTPGFVLDESRAYLENSLSNKEVGPAPALRILLQVYRAASRAFQDSTRPIIIIKLERLAKFTLDFSGSVKIEDMSFEFTKRKDTEAMVIPKVWIPVRNEAVLDSLYRQGKELATSLLSNRKDGTMMHPISENQFKARINKAFPEITYFNANATLQREQTLCAMLSIFWLVTNQHEAFIRGQSEDDQLSKQSWAWIQDWIATGAVLATEEAVDAALTFMAIHALGKITEFREELAPGHDPHAHDIALAHVLNHQPEVVPSFQRLPDKYKRLIVDSLSVDFQFSQFLQAENVAANLEVVKDKFMTHGDDGFTFFCFRIFAQMCGKMGKETLKGSKFMTESQFQRLRPGLDALQNLRSFEAGQAYNAFLLLQGSKALSNFASPEHQALSRLLCLGRANDYAMGSLVGEAFNELLPWERNRLTRWLTSDGINARPGYVLCEGSEFLQHAQTNPAVGLTAALRMLVRVGGYITAGSTSDKVQVHLSEIATWAKEAGPNANEFLQAGLEVRYEDQGTTRVYNVEVKRPLVRYGVNRTEGYQCCSCACCARSVSSFVIFVAMVAALVGGLGIMFLPDITRPWLQKFKAPSYTHFVCFGVFVLFLLFLFLICCHSRICKNCGSATTIVRKPHSRALLCGYSRLEPDGEPV